MDHSARHSVRLRLDRGDSGGTTYVEGLLNNEQITDDTTRPPRARSTAV